MGNTALLFLFKSFYLFLWGIFSDQGLNPCLLHWQVNSLPLNYLGFPSGSDSKESACNLGHLGSTPGLGRSPGGGHGNPLQYSCLENPHGQRSLEGYSPWGRKELDRTEATKHSPEPPGIPPFTLIGRLLCPRPLFLSSPHQLLILSFCGKEHTCLRPS